VFLEPFESDLSLVLRNVTVHNFDIILNLLRGQEGIGLSLGGSKDNCLTNSSINKENIGKCLHTVVEGTIDRNMLNVLLGFRLQVLCKIDHLPVWLKVVLSHVLNPPGNSGGEQKKLSIRCVLPYLFEDLVDVFFEAQFKHLVCLVHDEVLQLSEVEVASVHMVQDSAGGSNENVNAPAQLTRLIINGNSTIHCKNIIF